MLLQDCKEGSSLYHAQLCNAEEPIDSLSEPQSTGYKMSAAIVTPILPGDS